MSFSLVNLWIDHLAILAWIRCQPLPSHDEAHHTFVGALMIAVLVSLVAVVLRSTAWMAGAFYGSVSHIVLDSIVHADMQPFEPMILGNPMHLGANAMVFASLILLAPTAWLISMCVSTAIGWASDRRQQS